MQVLLWLKTCFVKQHHTISGGTSARYQPDHLFLPPREGSPRKRNESRGKMQVMRHFSEKQFGMKRNLPQWKQVTQMRCGAGTGYDVYLLKGYGCSAAWSSTGHSQEETRLQLILTS